MFKLFKRKKKTIIDDGFFHLRISYKANEKTHLDKLSDFCDISAKEGIPYYEEKDNSYLCDSSYSNIYKKFCFRVDSIFEEKVLTIYDSVYKK